MPAPRSKRKRAENDAAVAVAPTSRRRSRGDGAAAAAASDEPAEKKKNEAVGATGGDVAMKTTRKQDKTATSATATSDTSTLSNGKGGPKSHGGNSKSTPAAAEPVPKAEATNDTPASTDTKKNKSTNCSEDASLQPDGTAENAPENRIQGLLSHRKILLERLRQGRSAARDRLDIVIKENVSLKDQTSEQEIIAFRDLAKVATSLARKQARLDSEASTSAEKRTSVSLRRGSSVGKRMNAALSSLAPGAAAPAASPETVPSLQAQQQRQQQQQKVQPQTVSSGSTGTARPPVGTAAAPAQMSEQVAQAKALQAAAAASRAPSPKARKLPGAAPARGRPQSGKTPGASTMPQHSGLGGTTLPPNRLARPNRFVCPEARALRDRRNEIRNQLDSVFNRRQQRPEQGEQRVPGGNADAISSFTAVGVQGLRPHQASNRTNTNNLIFKEAGEPPYLPRRRKTHWDTLLEEMRWMATDFIEERKWKISVSRVLIKSALIPVKRCTGQPVDLLPSSSGDDKVNINAVKEECKSNSNGVETNTDQTNNADCQQRYKDVDLEDEASSRKVAGIISNMVSELSSLASDVGLFSPSNNANSKSLQHHQLTRIKSEGGDKTAILEETKSNNIMDTELTDSGIVSGDIDVAEKNNSNKLNHHEKEETFQRITKRIDGLLEKTKKSGAKTKSSSASAKTQGLGFGFTLGQAKAIDTVEDYWSRVGSGAILGGSISSGKTVVACTLLWIHRFSGPQLIVGSSDSMGKWMHELGRFEGLRCRQVSLSRGIIGSVCCEESMDNFKENEVVICEFSALKRVHKSVLSKFTSIIIDARYPDGYDGSRWPLCYEEEKFTKGSSSQSALISSELLSTSWWVNIVEAISSANANRLLIEGGNPLEMGKSRGGRSDRQVLEVLALQNAFILGPSMFRMPPFTFQKSVLAWARRRIKGSEGEGSKFEKVQKLLSSLIEPFCYRIQGAKLLEEVLPARSKSTCWEVRRCELTPLQRSAYDKVCFEIRSKLSSSLENVNEHLHPQMDCNETVSKALFRLRHQCMHSNLEESISDNRFKLSSLGVSELKNGTSVTHPRSSSQPDAELVENLLKNSGKLKELASILAAECGTSVPGHEPAQRLPRKKNKKELSKGKPKRPACKRIAILATLAEVQVLVSLLLSSLGIEHDLLLRQSYWSPDHKVAEQDFQSGTLAWVECQSALSRFNDDNPPDSGDLSDLVVIASPATLSGNHGGLGVEQADLVICVDEDWSGRGELLMKALISRCLARKNAQRNGNSRFLKLVAADTCEEKFLSSLYHSAERSYLVGERDPTVSGNWPWPISPLGVFIPPELPPSSVEMDLIRKCWSSVQSCKDSFSFPGCNLLQMRNCDLSDTLATSRELPPLLSSTAELVFLPIDQDSGRIQADMDLVVSLVEKEERANPLALLRHDRTSTFSQLISILPPPPAAFTEAIFSLTDLAVLPARMRLESYLKSVAYTDCEQSPEASLAQSPAIITEENFRAIDSAKLGGLVQKSESPEKQCYLASSLLFYKTPGTYSEPKNSTARSASEVSSSTSEQTSRGIKRRSNCYAAAFSSASGENVEQDGNQGSEEVAYFPPLFPLMLECSELASKDIENLQPGQMVPVKPAADAAIPPDPKRPRLELDAKSVKANSSDVIESLPAGSGSQPKAEAIRNEVIHSDPTSVLLGLREDYGLAGNGAVPSSRDSALSAACTFVELQSTPVGTMSGNEWASPQFPCDSEEADTTGRRDMGLGSMILIVSRKRRRGFVGLPMTSAGTSLWAGGPSVSSNPATHGPLNDFNLAGQGKKSKKKSASQRDIVIGASAFSPHSSVNLPHQSTRPFGQINQFPKGKEMHRRRLLATARQSGMGGTLFEAPFFRAAAVRVRNRVADRVARHIWTSNTAYEAGPGIPLILSREQAHGFPGPFEPNLTTWTSVVKELNEKDSCPGTEALEQSNSQREIFDRSSVSPLRVDFGPFRCGFLSLSSGMTAVSSPRSRVGVSLPMGVKVHQIVRGEDQASWDEVGDKKLEECVLRFGTNWLLAAQVLNGFQDIVHSHQIEDNRHFPRAGRSCRDHWENLARTNPSFSLRVRQAERVRCDNLSLKADQIANTTDKGRRVTFRRSDGALPDQDNSKLPDEESIVFLLSASNHDNDVTDRVQVGQPSPNIAKQGVSQPPKRRHSFAAFAAAKAKNHAIPMSIPGIAEGRPSDLTEHQSHIQSVQSSIAASWSSSGRTEMWPLQLLETADKQRRTALAATSTATVPTPARQRPPGSSRTSFNSAANKAHKSSGAVPTPNPHRTLPHAASSAKRPPTGSYPVAASSGANAGAPLPRASRTNNLSYAQSMQGYPPSANQATPANHSKAAKAPAASKNRDKNTSGGATKS